MSMSPVTQCRATLNSIFDVDSEAHANGHALPSYLQSSEDAGYEEAPYDGEVYGLGELSL